MENNKHLLSVQYVDKEDEGSAFNQNVPTVNLLKPTGYMQHHQFNIQQLYALPTLYLCVLYLSENKQQLVPLTA
jgi:hypothetical protein